MKITWFGDMTFRVQIAGRIIVVEPDGAAGDIDPAELRAGAQTLVSAQSSDLSAFDPATWHPKRRTRLIDEDEGIEGLSLFRIGARGLVADSLDEGLLVVCDADSGSDWGRWADDAVVVFAGSAPVVLAQGTALLDIARPRLIGVCVNDSAVETVFSGLSSTLAGASLVVLERGLALEA